MPVRDASATNRIPKLVECGYAWSESCVAALRQLVIIRIKEHSPQGHIRPGKRGRSTDGGLSYIR